MKNKINFQMISLLQLIFAILVILLHSNRVFQNDVLHFIQKSLFSRMAVPFFIVCSSFLIKMKSDQNPNYLPKYLKHSIKSYLLWSFVFVPYGLYYFTTQSIPSTLIPLGLVIALFYLGMCYHLWYIPAFLTGLLLVETAIKKINFKWTILLFFILYTIGSIETYSAYLTHTGIFSLYIDYTSIFFTSRNGVFFTPIFICMGYLLYHFRDHGFFTHNYDKKLLLAFVALCLEGAIIFPNQGMDKNFLFSLIPFTLFLFNWAIRTDWLKGENFYRLKQLSILYFFIHPIFIELLSFPSVSEMFDPLYFGWVTFFLTLFGTHCLSLLIMNLSNKFSQLKASS